MTAHTHSPPGASADLRRTLEEFRSLNPIVSVAAVIVFLALAEAGGETGLQDLADMTGLPFTHVCRHVDNLSKGDTRRVVGGLNLVRQIPPEAGCVPRLAMTESGWALFRRVFPDAVVPLRIAA